jgi:hypothetical protein
MQRLIRAVESEILRIKSDVALLNLKTALRRHALAQLKANFNPAQPRDDIGRWTSDGGGDDARVWLAGGRVPKIPLRRPPTGSERNLIARFLAREEGLPGLAGAIATGSTWLAELAPVYIASFDPPNTGGIASRSFLPASRI